jgi:acyl carrier protein
MDDVRARLERCFASVFPDLKRDEILAATPESVEPWDSLANATLVTVVEEEFELEIPVDELAELVSFADLAKDLEKRVDSDC